MSGQTTETFRRLTGRSVSEYSATSSILKGRSSRGRRHIQSAREVCTLSCSMVYSEQRTFRQTTISMISTARLHIGSAIGTGCSSTPIMDETYSTTKTMKAMSSSTGSRTKPSSTTRPTSDGATFSHPQDGITSSTEGCFRTRLWPSRTTGCEWATTLRKRVRTRNIPTSSIMVPE